MLKTGIYVRVSTEEQAQEGFSIRAQEQKLKDYIKIKEWSLYKVYADEGISGKNITARPAINEMIDDIKKGYVKNVLVYKIDRLTRSTADLISLVDLFNEHDCAFNSLTESIDTGSATGRMFIKIIGIFAEFERENIAERSRLGFERKVKEGYSLCSNQVSYGYDRKKGEKVQTINGKEAVIVREIYDMFLNNGMSYHFIAKYLNDRKIPTKNNLTWTAQQIIAILKNCNYIGYVRYAMADKKRNFENKGFHEPIISEETFNNTQILMKKSSKKIYKKHPKEEQYYAGILYCGICGSKLLIHGSMKKNINDGFLYYRCHNRLKKQCEAFSVQHKHIEKAFVEYINRFNDFDTLNEIQSIAKEKIKNENLELNSNLNKEISQLEKREKEISQKYINGEVEFNDYLELKKIIAEEKTRTTSLLKTIEDNVDEEITIKKENIISNLKENWELLNNAERRQFLINFVDKIIVINHREKGKRDGHVEICNVELSKEFKNNK